MTIKVSELTELSTPESNTHILGVNNSIDPIESVKIPLSSFVYGYSHNKSLTNYNDTGIVTIPVDPNTVASGEFIYTIFTTDNVDYQLLRKKSIWGVANKSGTLYTTIDSDVVESYITTNGSLDVETSIIDGVNEITLNVNVSSTLATTSINANWNLIYYGNKNITIL